MKYRSLGTDPAVRVSVVALGTMSIAGGAIHDSVEEKHAVATVCRALECGINFFDTAPAYGDGESESRLGQALKASGYPRHAYLIATKASGQTLSRQEITADCELSLKRLGVDYLDLYQIHWMKRAVPLEESLAAMDDLRRQGKVKMLGICNAGPIDTTTALNQVPLVSVQVPYSLLTRAAEFALQPTCLSHGTGILCYSPLAQGLLTGRYRNADEVPVLRARSRHFHKSRPSSRHGEEGCERELFEAIEAIDLIAREVGLPMSDLALAWLLHQPAVTSILAGASRPEQVAANVKTAGIELSAEVLARLDAATAVVKSAMGPNLDLWQGNDNSRVR